MRRPTVLFKRSMLAAMILQDYDQVARFLQLCEQSTSGIVTDPTIVHLATVALLMQDKPRDAWRCVLRYTGAALDDTVRTREKALGASTMASVIQYLEDHDQISGIEELLAVLEDQHRLDSALSTYSRKLMLNAIVNDTANTTDDHVWKLVEQYPRVFPVRTSTQRLDLFVVMCMERNRWELIARALGQRDMKRIPAIRSGLAVLLSRRVHTPSPTTTQLQAIAGLTAMTETCSTKVKAEFSDNVRRARELLEERHSL